MLATYYNFSKVYVDLPECFENFLCWHLNNSKKIRNSVLFLLLYLIFCVQYWIEFMFLQTENTRTHMQLLWPKSSVFWSSCLDCMYYHLVFITYILSLVFKKKKQKTKLYQNYFFKDLLILFLIRFKIPRYIITLHELLAHTPHEHVERKSLEFAKSKLEELSRWDFLCFYSIILKQRLWNVKWIFSFWFCSF